MKQNLGLRDLEWAFTQQSELEVGLERKENSAHRVLVDKKAEDMEGEEMMIPGQANGAQGVWDANGTHHG
jgi:hypothetical protein